MALALSPVVELLEVVMAQSEVRSDEIRAFLGEGTEFKGLLSFQGTVRIEGKLEGEVVTKDTLIVGGNADIKAEITVGTVISEGKIVGNVTASKRVEIRSKSRLIGNIKTPSLMIEEGAIFDGTCQMEKGEEKVIHLKAKDEK